MERKLDTTIPTPPKVDIRRNPMEEQLIHVLDNILIQAKRRVIVQIR
jgi:hypothetical protein